MIGSRPSGHLGFNMFQTSPSPTRMVGAGTVHSLLWTFLRLRSSCKTANMNISSDGDSDSDLTVSLKMVLAGQADQAPRRGGRQSSRQERGPGTQVAPQSRRWAPFIWKDSGFGLFQEVSHGSVPCRPLIYRR